MRDAAIERELNSLPHSSFERHHRDRLLRSGQRLADRCPVCASLLIANGAAKYSNAFLLSGDERPFDVMLVITCLRYYCRARAHEVVDAIWKKWNPA